MTENLYCIVGASGSGKTIIAEMLEKDYGLTSIQSYTTRPKRNPLESGHTFVTSEQFNELQDVCAYDKYNGYDYGATAQQIDESSLYVVNPAGIEQLRKNYNGSKKIYTIYIECRLADRYGRMRSRGNTCEEVLHRIINDTVEFRGCKDYCNLVVRNNDSDEFNEVVQKVWKFIQSKERW